MDLENPTERRLYELYKFCSRYGVHGHLTSQIFTAPEDSAMPTADYGSSRIAQEWFADFMPPHTFAFETLLRGNEWEGIDEWRIQMTLMELKLVAATQKEGFFR